MNLPIEIVQQRGDSPLFLILAVLAGVSRNARFHCEHVPPQTIRLNEFANDLPSLIASHSISKCRLLPVSRPNILRCILRQEAERVGAQAEFLISRFGLLNEVIQHARDRR